MYSLLSSNQIKRVFGDQRNHGNNPHPWSMWSY